MFGVLVAILHLDDVPRQLSFARPREVAFVLLPRIP
jgi:hypothetical protein